LRGAQVTRGLTKQKEENEKILLTQNDENVFIDREILITLVVLLFDS
jgi:hypothetical protein